jgi:hypothetical protein
MKTTALLLSLLLFAACASPTAVIDRQNYNCDPGQALEIAVGYDPGNQGGELGDREFLVEVANNSDTDVTVKTDRNPGLPMAYEQTDITIDAGKDHLFHLRASAPLGWSAVQPTLGTRSGIVEVLTTVMLSNGDAYRCVFRVQVQ